MLIIAHDRMAAGKRSVWTQASRTLLVVATLPSGEGGLDSPWPAASEKQKYGVRGSNTELLHMSHSGWHYTNWAAEGIVIKMCSQSSTGHGNVDTGRPMRSIWQPPTWWVGT